MSTPFHSIPHQTVPRTIFHTPHQTPEEQLATHNYVLNLDGRKDQPGDLRRYARTIVTGLGTAAAMNNGSYAAQGTRLVVGAAAAHIYQMYLKARQDANLDHKISYITLTRLVQSLNRAVETTPHHADNMNLIYHSFIELHVFLHQYKAHLDPAVYEEACQELERGNTWFKEEAAKMKWKPHTDYEHEGDHFGLNASGGHLPANLHPTLLHNTHPDNLPAGYTIHKYA